MRMVTVLLALLSVASLAAAIVALMEARWALLGLGAMLALGGLVVAVAVESGAAGTRHLAWAARRAKAPYLVSAGLAAISGILPLGAIIAMAWTVFDRVPVTLSDGSVDAVTLAIAYGVAAGPWTLAATWLRYAPRTLTGAHAYAGHLMAVAGVAYYLLPSLSLTTMGLVMAAIALPPAIVGTLIGLADKANLPQSALGKHRRSKPIASSAWARANGLPPSPAERTRS